MSEPWKHSKDESDHSRKGLWKVVSGETPVRAWFAFEDDAKAFCDFANTVADIKEFGIPYAPTGDADTDEAMKRGLADPT